MILDAGNIVKKAARNKELEAGIILKTMDSLGYSAMNIGPQDLNLKSGYFRAVEQKINFPLISSNLVWEKEEPSAWKQYSIQNVSGMRVAILGLMPPDLQNTSNQNTEWANVKVRAPEEALQELLPQVEQQAELIILFSQYPLNINQELLAAYPAIDVVLSGQGYEAGCSGIFDQEKIEGKPVLRVTNQGQRLGVLTMTMDFQGSVLSWENKDIALDRKTPDDMEILAEIKQARLKNSPLMEERAKLMKMSPKEAVEYLRQQQGGEQEPIPDNILKMLKQQHQQSQKQKNSS